MAQLLAEKLARMGAIKSDLDNLIFEGVLYSRDISFSQRVQAAAQQMYQDYQQQNIKCLLVKDGPILTLWLSQPFKAFKNAVQTPPFLPTVVPPQPKPQEVSEAPEDETNVEINFGSQTHSQSVSTKKIMIYRGNIYKVIVNEKPSPDVPLKSKPERLKKRIYRGFVY